MYTDFYFPISRGRLAVGKREESSTELKTYPASELLPHNNGSRNPGIV